jgi:hypothetical protein
MPFSGLPSWALLYRGAKIMQNSPNRIDWKPGERCLDGSSPILGAGISGVAAARSAAENGASIERYNELARKGVDEDFSKDPSLMHPIVKPPFLGTVSRTDSMSSGAMVTLAGLVIDENQRVLNDNDDPIAGLYATGNCSGGRYSADYITPISGNSIGWAFTMGRIAGKYIAESRRDEKEL